MQRLVAFALSFLIGSGGALAQGATPSATVRCVDQAMDFHGDAARADLVIFAAGNQWMVLPSLIAAFRRTHPAVRNVFYETLPPGLLARQMAAHGKIHLGDMTVSARPDVYLAGKRRMAKELSLGAVGTPVAYASNTLAIMVRRRNPQHVRSLRDLGRSNVRVAMPNPTTEGVAKQIEKAFVRAGGPALVSQIMVTKLRAGTTKLTQIHHRQTPMWILAGAADAGPVWISEALYQERIHSGLQAVRIPARDNVSATYEAAATRSARHPSVARAFVEFLTTPTAQAIYRSYGFTQP